MSEDLRTPRVRDCKMDTKPKHQSQEDTQTSARCTMSVCWRTVVDISGFQPSEIHRWQDHQEANRDDDGVHSTQRLRNKSGVQDHRLCATGRGAQATWLASKLPLAVLGLQTRSLFCAGSLISGSQSFERRRWCPLRWKLFLASTKLKEDSPDNYKMVIEPAFGATKLPNHESVKL